MRPVLKHLAEDFMHACLVKADERGAPTDATKPAAVVKPNESSLVHGSDLIKLGDGVD